MRIKNSLSLLLLAAFISLFAQTAVQADDSFDVELSDQFLANVKIQEGGTCSLFASAGLVEAACFRRTGKHVNFSEAALYLQYLDTLLLSPSGNYPILPKSQGEFTEMDGVLRSGWSVDHLIKGMDCFNETDLPFDMHFVQHVQAIIQAYGKEEAHLLEQAPSQAKSSQDLARLMGSIRRDEQRAADEELRFEFGQYISPSGSDPDIAACLSGKPMRVADLSAHPWERVSGDVVEAQVRQHHVPVLCEREWSYTNSDGSKTEGLHAFVVSGERGGNDGKKEFLIRDSNIEQPYWTALPDCQRAWVIQD